MISHHKGPVNTLRIVFLCIRDFWSSSSKYQLGHSVHQAFLMGGVHFFSRVRPLFPTSMVFPVPRSRGVGVGVILWLPPSLGRFGPVEFRFGASPGVSQTNQTPESNTGDSSLVALVAECQNSAALRQAQTTVCRVSIWPPIDSQIFQNISRVGPIKLSDLTLQMVTLRCFSGKNSPNWS